MNLALSYPGGLICNKTKKSKSSSGKLDSINCFVAFHSNMRQTILNYNVPNGGARGVMVIVVGNGHGDTSSNPGRDWLPFA